MIECDYTLECRCMGKHHQAIDITDSIYMRQVSLHIFIHRYAASCAFKTDVRVIHRIKIRSSAYCHKHLFSLY